MATMATEREEPLSISLSHDHVSHVDVGVGQENATLSILSLLISLSSPPFIVFLLSASISLPLSCFLFPFCLSLFRSFFLYLFSSFFPCVFPSSFRSVCVYGVLYLLLTIRLENLPWAQGTRPCTSSRACSGLVAELEGQILVAQVDVARQLPCCKPRASRVGSLRT